MHRHLLDAVYKLVRANSNCKDLQDACVIADSHGRVVGTGFIGISRAQSGLPCGCVGYCRSSHAVTRAVAGCSSRIKHARLCVCWHAPCPDCINLLIGTPIQEIVSAIDDPQSPSSILWERHGCVWTIHPYSPSTLRDRKDDIDD